MNCQLVTTAQQPEAPRVNDNRAIRHLWACKRYDTLQIAQLVKVTEAEVYNLTARLGEQRRAGQ
jgi:hypothetical protein